ncbi:methyltransferase family protein [Actinoplanes sp. CA-030573]|uniref:methyltransferase family protein n=1 Tax=Actinoplanes sp. CA-030573 TaxID=3239898 RepID=UPI003D942A5A
MLIFGYALVAYASFLVSVGWAVLFLAGGMDGPATTSASTALAIDGALLLAFAVQHSVMARVGFKRRVARLIPPAAERSTYVLSAALLMIAIFGGWQPVPATVWHVSLPWSAPIWLLYAAGWVLVVWSTFAVDHADFLGLRQAYAHLRHRAHHEPAFTDRRLYGWCRHPMMLGLLVTFWATPHLTAGHLFFAVASSAYIGLGIRFEERDLRARLGAGYADYARRVPMLVPAPRRRTRQTWLAPPST